MLLDEVTKDVTSSVDKQNELGVQITDLNDVPETGPTNGGLWYKIENVVAVFADMKKSTDLNTRTVPKTAARAYAYFVNSMAVISYRLGAKYVDVQGDAVFALFSGQDSLFHATACAITMRTLTDTLIAGRLSKDCGTEWSLAVGVGIDCKTVLVRRLGLRGAKVNEVWAGKPVNTAAKLSSFTNANEVLVSSRVFDQYKAAKSLRQRAIIWSCGCGIEGIGDGLDAAAGTTRNLWNEEPVPADKGFDFETMYRLQSKWCPRHGPEFCEVIYTGKRP